jgi:hypothetical protein
VTVAELLAREFAGGVTVTNCVAHMGLSILDRPSACSLCQADVRNTLARAIRANEWLNEWKTDAERLLAKEAS